MLKMTARPQELDEDVRVPPRRRMSEDEFVEWCGPKTRAEWVDGKVVIMSPDNSGNSDLGGWLLSIVRSFVSRRKLGIVRGPGFFVRLPRQRRRRLPDLLFAGPSRQHMLEEQRFNGAPDLIMEVVSPDSESRDRREKYLEYERAGVREYWIIDPLSQRLEAYALRRGAYVLIPEKDGKIASGVIRGFWLKTEWFWQRSLPAELDVLKELGVA